MNTGVVTPFKAWIVVRVAANASTSAREPEYAASRVVITPGSIRAGGSAPMKPAITPDLARPCGTSALRRFVHDSTTSTAAHGTPATIDAQTAPPPREMPQ